MSDQLTKKDLEHLRDDLGAKFDNVDKQMRLLDGKIDKAVDDLTEVIGQFAHSVQDEVIGIKKDITKSTDAIDRLANTLDGFASRIETQEVENAASDARFNKLLSWARDVSKKTGIPLKDL